MSAGPPRQPNRPPRRRDPAGVEPQPVDCVLHQLEAAFLRLEPTVWLLLLGPWLMLTLLRFTTRPLRRR